MEGKMKNIPSRRVLIAEDHNEFRRLLAESFRAKSYAVTECRDGIELIEQLSGFLRDPGQPSPFDLIVSDIRMPGVTGLSVLAGLHEFQNSPAVILITAFGDESTHAEAQRLGAAATVDKPFEIDMLLARAGEVLQRIA
jgi:DNA-binding response OmpR family regulator